MCSIFGKGVGKLTATYTFVSWDPGKFNSASHVGASGDCFLVCCDDFINKVFTGSWFWMLEGRDCGLVVSGNNDSSTYLMCLYEVESK